MAVTDDASADPAVTGLSRRLIGTFSNPVYVTAPPGDRSRLFVVEQDGHDPRRPSRAQARAAVPRHPRSRRGRRRAGPPVDGLRARLRKNHRFYVYFTRARRRHPDLEFRAAATTARKRSARTILTQEHSTIHQPQRRPARSSAPTAACTSASGDGGGGGDPSAGQDLGRTLGKILRINPSGRPRIPRSNPFRGRSGAKPAVYSYGLRNPWRFSFDRMTGDLSIGDVGQDAYEEVDFVRRGRGAARTSAGTSSRATTCTTAARARPARPAGHRALAQLGLLLDHRRLRRARPLVREPPGPLRVRRPLRGDVRGARLAPGGVSGRRRRSRPRAAAVSFGEDARGRVYAVSLAGAVYRLAPK